MIFWEIVDKGREEDQNTTNMFILMVCGLEKQQVPANRN